MSTLDDLLAPINNGPNLRDGLCVGRWNLFDTTDDPAANERATELCRQCGVLQRCTDWSATLSDRELSGVVAGVVRVHASDRKRRSRVTA